MKVRRLFQATAAIASVGALSACLQWGDYADGDACADVYDDVVPVLTAELGVTPAHEVGNSYPADVDTGQTEVHIWCVLSLDTRLDLSADDARRQSVRRGVEEVVSILPEGVYVTVTYASVEGEQYRAERQDSFFSPGTPLPTP